MSASFTNVNTEFINWLSYPPAITTSTLPDGNIPCGKVHPPPLPPMKDSLVNISDANQTISNIGGLIAKTNVDMTLVMHNTGGQTGYVLTSNGTTFENASWQAPPAGETGPQGPTGPAGGGGGVTVVEDTTDTTRMPVLFQDFGSGSTLNGNTGINILPAYSVLCLQNNPLQNITATSVAGQASGPPTLLTAAQLYGGIIFFPAGSAQYQYVLDSGANISGLFGGDGNLNIGDSFRCLMSFQNPIISNTLNINISGDNTAIVVYQGFPTGTFTTTASIDAIFVFQGSGVWYMYG